MKIKVHIDCVNIHVPRETTGNGVIDAKLKAASEPNPIRVDKQKAEIARLRDALNELTAEHIEWGGKNDRLEARRKELQDANTQLSAKLVEDAKTYDQLRASFQQKQADLENVMADAQHWKDRCTELQEKLGTLRKERDELLDAATKPEKKRKYRKKLTDEEVWRVRRLIKNGRSDIWIQRQVGIPNLIVNRIRHGKNYTAVPEEPPHPPTKVHAGHGVEK